MDEGREDAHGSSFLTSTRSTGGDEDTCVLVIQSTAGPEATSRVPECLSENASAPILGGSCDNRSIYLPLCWERTVTRGYAKEVCVEIREIGWGEDGIFESRSVHFSANLFRKSLCDSRDLAC
jgi:hypothetical protein